MKPVSRPPTPYRVWGRGLCGVGVTVLLLGAAGLVVAAALPWATFTVLNTPIALPGVALGVGAITASIGAACAAQFGFVRRFAWLGVLLGLAAMYLGVRAEDETGKVVVKNLLTVERRLAPVNARLAEVSLPPFQPFGSTIGARRDHMGAGIRYTIWAGAAVAAGSLFLLVGDRLRRTCGYCKRAWSAKRGENAAFCGLCGRRNTNEPLCTKCASPLLRGEMFCPTCGTGTITKPAPV